MASEEMSFEHVDGRRTTDACLYFGSGELKRYCARISEKHFFFFFFFFLYRKLHVFYSAILTACFRHDVNNVKKRRNAGDLAPKLLTL